MYSLIKKCDKLLYFRKFLIVILGFHNLFNSEKSGSRKKLTNITIKYQQQI